MFLINGIPVALVEAKGAKTGLEEALVQIRRYLRETPEMLTTPQVFDITHLLEFYYGATWSLDRKGLFEWRGDSSSPSSSPPRGAREEIVSQPARGGSFEAKVKAFFERERFLK